MSMHQISSKYLETYHERKKVRQTVEQTGRQAYFESESDSVSINIKKDRFVLSLFGCCMHLHMRNVPLYLDVVGLR